MERPSLRLLLGVMLLVTTTACAAAINTVAVADAQAAARAKSALVNDPEIGAFAIDVRVVDGVALLSGRVPRDVDVTRAVAIVQAVSGVSAVRSELVVGDAPPLLPSETSTAVPAREPGLQGDGAAGASADWVLAIGGEVGWNSPDGGPLDADESFGPLVRIGAGTGLGPSLGFGWFATDLMSQTASPGEIVGRVRVRPVMAGVGYTVRGGRVSLRLSAVGGVAFNGVTPSIQLNSREIPLQVRNSPVWRPGASVWIDASSRIALSASVGYVMTHPRYFVLVDGDLVRRRLDADTVLFRVGLAYKVF